MPEFTNPYQEFQTFIDRYTAENERLAQKSFRVMIVRMIIFICLIITLYYALTVASSLWFTFLGGLVLIFSLAIKYHQKLKYEKEIVSWKAKVNQNEINRLNGDLSQIPQGLSYLNKQHPYAFDLDIFGSPSLFQLVDRSCTPSGKQSFVSSLLHPLESKEISSRQHIVKTLSKRVGFRQSLEAIGRYWNDKDRRAKRKPEISVIEKWIKNKESSRFDGYLKFLNVFSPLLLLGLLLVYPGWAFQLVLLFIFINYLFLVTVVNRVNTMTREISQSVNLIKSYRQLIEVIEKQDFKDESLQRMQAKFNLDGKPASIIFRDLERILHSFDSRSNLLYAIINGLLLLDIYWYLKALRWKKNYALHIIECIQAYGKWEVLCSQAGFAYAYPEYCWPEILTEGSYQFEAKKLGHPLINAKKRVTNDFQLYGAGKVGLVTGSNMSGKSTFLRTVGLATTMAQMGLPVCAQHFKLSPIEVYSGMRTEDDLGESVSSFYAELKRIKGLLEKTDKSEPVLYLLDEILKGTNSDDRHRGSIGLIHQLMEAKAFGLISTHDLALGKLSETYEKLENYSFNSQLIEGELHFDFKLQPGICHTFNATTLMKKMGIIKPEST